MSETVTVLLAEGDPLTRAGLRVALDGGDLEVCAEAADAAGAIAIAEALQPDVCVVAARLAGGATAAIRGMAARSPGTRSVMLSAASSKGEFLGAMRAGARGYLRADMSTSRLARVLAAVAAGEVAVPRDLTVDLLDEVQERDRVRDRVSSRSRVPLTAREWEILRLLGDSLPTAGIAAQLDISQVTVRRHISALVAKLELPDRAAAVRLLRSAQ